MSFFQYAIENSGQIFSLTLDHIKLTAIAVFFSILIGVPIGILVSYVKQANKPIMLAASTVQAVPSMALLGLMIPLLGIGTLPAIVTVTIYSLLPIIKNTYTGLANINSDTIEAAKGIGLTKKQILTQVQLPLALPMIMAGIRISAVTAVGLMTMAAFIGAGGLGYLVFAGIRSINNSQILCGAIPACILALIVDWLAAKVEMIVTPISLQTGDKEKIKKNTRKNKIIVAVVTILIVIAIIISSIGKTPKGDRIIKVASKDYTEQVIVGNMVSDLIEDRTDIKVDRTNLSLGMSSTIIAGLQDEDLDMYVDYMGTAYSDILKHEPISDIDVVYDTIKEEMYDIYNLKVLDKMAFNNTYTVSVTPETAEKYDLKTISDFKKYAGNFKFGCIFEFAEKADGLKGMQKAYGFEVDEVIVLDGAPRYQALMSGEVDAIDAFSTEGLVKKFNLVSLEDDLQYFPPYYAVPVIREEALNEFPEVEALMNELGSVLTNDVMAELNYRVDELQETPQSVSRSFLKEIGLIEKNS